MKPEGRKQETLRRLFLRRFSNKFTLETFKQSLKCETLSDAGMDSNCTVQKILNSAS
jgi:hypothetical protein